MEGLPLAHSSGELRRKFPCGVDSAEQGGLVVMAAAWKPAADAHYMALSALLHPPGCAIARKN